MIDKIKQARRAAVPLVAIKSYDVAQSIAIVKASINGSPCIVWDVIRGAWAANNAAQAVASECERTYGPLADNLVGFLQAATNFPEGTVAICLQLTEYMDGPGGDRVRQAVFNLRDRYKTSRRMLIGIGTSADVPPGMVLDFVFVEDALPDEDSLALIAKELEEAATGKTGLPPNYDAARAAIGLSAFAAEQAISLNCSKDGINIQGVWEAKRYMVEKTRGLSVDNGQETFDDVGGMENAKAFGRALFNGPEPPAVVVRVEEIEKVLAGSVGDLSGTSQDALQVLLNAMQDNRWSGMLAFGPAGTGKSYYSKVLAKTFSAYSIVLDINATKGSLVGSSEAAIRSAIATIKAIGGQRVFFVGTCNKLDSLPPELRRRFRLGTWFFDMPSPEERAAIWRICLQKNGLPLDCRIPDDSLYSSADVANVCETARMMGKEPIEVAQFIVPAGQSGREQIEACRRLADGRFVSASYPGPYRMPTLTEEVGRTIRSFG